MVISAPLGTGSSELTLDNVLYAPSVGYALVSLGALDALGYNMTIEAGHMQITSPSGSVVARVPRTARGLYRVSHEEGGYAVEIVNVMELHRRMGHNPHRGVS